MRDFAGSITVFSFYLCAYRSIGWKREITAVKNDCVRIDELLINKNEWGPILLTSDTLVSFGCTQIRDKQWRTPCFRNFEFDGIQACFGYGTAPVAYLHLFQNKVSLFEDESAAAV